MTTTGNNMVQMKRVRAMLPKGLRRARFATIAHSDAYKQYFASGDDSPAIRSILIRLYESRGSSKAAREARKALEREAASRRPVFVPEVNLRDKCAARRAARRAQEQVERNQAHVRDFLAGRAPSVSVNFDSLSEIRDLLEELLPALRAGERFLLQAGKGRASRYYTVSQDNVDDMLDAFREKQDTTEVATYDGEWVVHVEQARARSRSRGQRLASAPTGPGRRESSSPTCTISNARS